MEQDVEGGLTGYRHVCSGCLNSERNLMSLDNTLFQVFRLIIYDFGAENFADPLSEIEHLVCWECAALMRRFARFKQQVHSAQEHLRILALNRGQESLEHSYITQTLSPLEAVIKTDYDKIFFDYTVQEANWIEPYIVQGMKNEHFDVAQVVRDNIDLDLEADILHAPELEHLEPRGSSMPQIVVSAAGAGMLSIEAVKGEPRAQPTIDLTLNPLSQNEIETVIIQAKSKPALDKPSKDGMKCGFVTDYMTDAEMLDYREKAKQTVSYAGSSYKCELCIVGFLTQQQVEEHFVAVHRPKAGQVSCRICYVYVQPDKLDAHIEEHYTRYICKFCAHVEASRRLMMIHVARHSKSQVTSGGVIKIGDEGTQPKRRKKKDKGREGASGPVKPGDLRKLLSKTTIEGYKCLECDMFFKNSRSRKNHVDRFHREGLQCDHCKKRFVNKTTLATHLRLHAGPLPKEKCPICNKMVRVIQLKYHIRRHQNHTRYECLDCQKIFSHLATYQAHLKYSRAHASDEVFKFPCPMCNRGYPTKEQMQDHFNYQHLGKTAHKCPICEKPIASRANVDKHMMRVHGEKKDKPRNHTCQQCGKTFTDKKALNQHEVIHSGDRPLSCEICQQTFKQKASLYTHRKRVHKVFPSKRVVEFMDTKPAT